MSTLRTPLHPQIPVLDVYIADTTPSSSQGCMFTLWNPLHPQIPGLPHSLGTSRAPRGSRSMKTGRQTNRSRQKTLMSLLHLPHWQHPPLPLGDPKPTLHRLWNPVLLSPSFQPTFSITYPISITHPMSPLPYPKCLYHLILLNISSPHPMSLCHPILSPPLHPTVSITPSCVSITPSFVSP